LISRSDRRIAVKPSRLSPEHPHGTHLAFWRDLIFGRQILFAIKKVSSHVRGFTMRTRKYLEIWQTDCSETSVFVSGAPPWHPCGVCARFHFGDMISCFPNDACPENTKLKRRLVRFDSNVSEYLEAKVEEHHCSSNEYQ
jgi:hypothetical protein